MPDSQVVTRLLSRPSWPALILTRSLLGALVGFCAFAVAGLTGLAGAETPTQVFEETADHGLYIARSRSAFDGQVFDSALSSAKASGVNLVIVVPSDPQPTAKAFALRVRQVGDDIDGVIVVGLDGGIFASVGEEFEDAEVRAVAAAQSGLAPGPAADAFVHELTVEVIVTDPPLYRQLAGIAVKLLIALALIVFAELVYRQAKKRFLADRAERSASV